MPLFDDTIPKMGLTFQERVLNYLARQDAALEVLIGNAEEGNDSLAQIIKDTNAKLLLLIEALNKAVTSVANMDLDLDEVKESLKDLQVKVNSIHVNTTNINDEAVETNVKLGDIKTNTSNALNKLDEIIANTEPVVTP